VRPGLVVINPLCLDDLSSLIEAHVKKELEYLASTIHKLIKVFDKLVYAEIGIEFPGMFTALK
jgi:hypothetical protein